MAIMVDFFFLFSVSKTLVYVPKYNLNFKKKIDFALRKFVTASLPYYT